MRNAMLSASNEKINIELIIAAMKPIKQMLGIKKLTQPIREAQHKKITAICAIKEIIKNDQRLMLAEKCGVDNSKLGNNSK